jgi:ABC-2 type transport system permease protein
MTAMAAFFDRDVRLALSQRFGLLVPFVSIGFTVAGFAYLSHLINPQAQNRWTQEHLNYFSYVVLSMTFMLLLNGAMQAVASAIRRDQLAGTLQGIIAAPVTVGQIVVASSLWPIGFAAAQAGATIGWAVLFGLHLRAFNAAEFFAVLLLSMACMLSIGAIAGAVVLRFRQSPPSSFLTGGAVAMLSGALFPVALLPPVLRDISWILPLTHALSGMRGALSGAPFEYVSRELWWLGIATAVLIPCAFAAFSVALREAQRDGTLASY